MSVSQESGGSWLCTMGWGHSLYRCQGVSSPCSHRVQLRSISGCSKDWWRPRKQWPVIHLDSFSGRTNNIDFNRSCKKKKKPQKCSVLTLHYLNTTSTTPGGCTLTQRQPHRHPRNPCPTHLSVSTHIHQINGHHKNISYLKFLPV